MFQLHSHLGVKSFCSVDRGFFLLLTDVYKSFIWSSCHRGIDEMIVVCGKHVVWHISWELMDMCSSVCTNMHMLFYLWGIKTLIAAVPVVRLFLVPLASPQLSWGTKDRSLCGTGLAGLDSSKEYFLQKIRMHLKNVYCAVKCLPSFSEILRKWRQVEFPLTRCVLWRERCCYWA